MNVLEFIDQIIGGIFRPKPVYKPIIPPKVRADMQRLNISEKELIGAFYSKDIRSGHVPNSTLGVANFYGRLVCALYRRDRNDPMQWVIIGCSAYNKKTSDIVTGKRYWNKRLYTKRQLYKRYGKTRFT